MASGPSIPSAAGPTGTGTASAAVCDDYQALQDSLAAVVSVDVAKAGLDGLKSALGTVADRLATLKASAQQEFAPQVDELDRAVQQLQATVEDASSGGGTAALKSIGSRLAAVATAGRSLASAVAKACP